MDRFQQLLYDLSELLEITLYADGQQRCRININDFLEVQIQYDSSKERILLATFCAEIPPGKFRENVLKESLKANGIFPRRGTYGYSEQKNQLALFEYVSMEYLQREKFADILAAFIERAEKTKQGIESNNLSALLDMTSNKNRSAFEL